MKTTKLYWSERGMINCLEHAPYRGSDTWVYDRWRAMTKAEIAEMTAHSDGPPSCECCGKKQGDPLEAKTA